MNKTTRYFLFISLLFTISCKTTKFVPQDQYLLEKVKISTDHKELKPAVLQPYVKQKPNFRVLTLFPTRLNLYNYSGSDSTKKWNKFWRKVGSPPVILDDNLTERSRQDLQKAAINRGFLNATVDTSSVRAKKKATISFKVKTEIPYRVRNYTYDIGNEQVASFVKRDSNNTLLKKGVLFDRSFLEKERQRIVTLLKQNGYYALSKEMISYVADTSLNSHEVDITLQLFQNSGRNYNESVPNEQRQYTVKNIYILTEYDPTSTNITSSGKIDTSMHKGYTIVYGEKRWLRPEVLSSSTYIMPNTLYDEREIDLTYNSFSRLKAVKYVNIRFEPFGDPDSCQLSGFLMLSSSKNQAVTTELEGTNSAGDLGGAVSVSYQHRNIFHGSETFTTTVRAAYEHLSGAGSKTNFTEYGVESTLSFPKFVFPFISYDIKRKVRAISELVGTYNIQTRPEYERVISGLTWRYRWSTTDGSHRHSLDLLDGYYVYLPWIDSEFYQNSLQYNPLLLNSYQNHFILRTGYTYYLTNQNKKNINNQYYALRLNIEAAGNFLNLMSHLTNSNKVNGTYQFLGVNYSQYLKGEIDFSRSHNIDEANVIAWHTNIGVAYPYGNSEILPFEKRFFGGGANSVRGWSVRSLGPGSYKQAGTVADFVNHSGDIKLDLSVELRSKLFWLLESALFIDAGNIWTIRNYDIQPGGLFKLNSFYKEIALAYGLGLRLNFSFLVLRFDAGFKAYDPEKDGSEKWRFSNFGSNDFALHLAVGYPF